MTGHQDIFQQAMNQGHSAAWDQMWDRAAAYYRQALGEFPDNPQALTSLGLALIELQDYDEALRCYQKAAKAAPDDPVPLEKIAQLGERMGNLDMAIQASLKVAEHYLNNRDAKKAIENWERVTRLNPENLQGHSRLALVYERLGEKDKAVSEYLITASILQNTGNLQKAEKAVALALKIAPNNSDVLQARNLLKDFKPLPRPVRPRGSTAPILMSQVRQLQKPQKAQPDLDPVTQASQKALTMLAGMLFDAESEASEPAARRGLQNLVSSVTGRLNKPTDRTRMLMHLSQVVDMQTRGELLQAADELQRAMDVGLDHPAAAYDLGYLYARLGRFESAIRNLQNSVKNPDFAFGTRLLLGELLYRKRQHKEASIEYLEALKLAEVQLAPPDQAKQMMELYELLIESHHQQEDTQAQQRLCENIQKMLARADWHAQLEKARRQLSEQKDKGTVTPLAELLTEARSSQMIDSVAAIYEMANRGQLRTAMEEALFALQLAPNYLPLHSLVGELLVKESSIPKAITKYDVVARTYAARGELSQAVQYSRKIVELDPADMGARNRLIEQLVDSGKIEEALDEYSQSAEIHCSLADLGAARKTYMDALHLAQKANVERSLKIKLLHRVADIDIQSLDWRQALRVLEQIRTLQPEEPEARTQIIQLNLRLGQEQQALAELDDYIAYLSSNNQQGKLIQYFDALLKDNPDSVPMRRRLADLYRQMGRIEDAIDQLDSLGEMLLGAGDRAGAIQIVETIISLNPSNRAEYLQLLKQLHGERDGTGSLPPHSK